MPTLVDPTCDWDGLTRSTPTRNGSPSRSECRTLARNACTAGRPNLPMFEPRKSVSSGSRNVDKVDATRRPSILQQQSQLVAAAAPGLNDVARIAGHGKNLTTMHVDQLTLA